MCFSLLFIARESTKLFIDSWFYDKRTTWLFTCSCLFLLLCFVFISPSHYCMLCAPESIRDLDSEMVDIVHLNLLSLICFCIELLRTYFLVLLTTEHLKDCLIFRWQELTKWWMNYFPVSGLHIFVPCMCIPELLKYPHVYLNHNNKRV